MPTLTRDQLVNLIKLRPLILRNCSMCGYELSYFYNENQLLFDTGCLCIEKCPEPRQEQSLDRLLEQEGWQKYFKEFYKEEIAKDENEIIPA